MFTIILKELLNGAIYPNYVMPFPQCQHPQICFVPTEYTLSHYILQHGKQRYLSQSAAIYCGQNHNKGYEYVEKATSIATKYEGNEN
jgi:hypothetical protein